MPQDRRTQSVLAMTRDKATSWGRATPAGEFRAYRWFRRVNRAGLALGTITSCVLAIGRPGLGFVTCVVLMVVVLPVGFVLELALRPPGGDKPVSGRQVAIDRKAAARSAKIFRHGSAHPRRIDYLAPGKASPDRASARADIVYQRSCSEIRWTGEILIIFDGRGRHRRSVCAGGVESDFLPPAMGSGKGVPTAPTAAPVVAAIALLKPGPQPIDVLVLLDSRSRHLGTFDVRGFSETAITDVARKAGVELSVYKLPARFGHSREALAEAMFPESVFHRLHPR
jgi:hypothetical protein